MKFQDTGCFNCNRHKKKFVPSSRTEALPLNTLQCHSQDATFFWREGDLIPQQEGGYIWHEILNLSPDNDSNSIGKEMEW